MRKNIFLWALYDFANSLLIAALVGLYFSQWVVIDNGFDEIWYGGTFSLATLFVLISAPFWGAWSDKIGRRMPFITWVTLVMILFGSLLAFVINSSLLRSQKVILALILFFLIQYAYQLSLIFYNALLSKLSAVKNRGKISGIGEAFGNFGWIIGPAILLPFANGQLTLFGQSGRAQVFLPAVFMFTLFALPMLFLFKESKDGQKINAKSIYKKAVQGFKDLLTKNRNIFIFLIGFCFISDAILTAQLYFAIFLDQIYRITDNQKVTFLALMMSFGVLGAFILGKKSDSFGIKKVLIFSSILIAISLYFITQSSSLQILYFFSVFVGIGWGGFYATSRALLVKISPPTQLGEYFGFYSTFQRFASIIGPLTWGGIIFALKDYGLVKYRIAGLSLILLMAFGIFLLTKVKETPSSSS